MLHNSDNDDGESDSAIATVTTGSTTTSIDEVTSTLTATTVKTSPRKSQRIQSKLSQKENIIVAMNNNSNSNSNSDSSSNTNQKNQTKKETHNGTHITKASFTTQRKRSDSTSIIVTSAAATTTTSNSSPTMPQLLLQYWIIVRMVSCIYTLGIQSIPSWIRRFGFAVLGMSSSSSSFTNSIYPHFEFYLYMSVVIIPIITPTVVQDMISSSFTSSTNTTSTTNTTPPPSRSTTLIQVYYIQYYILPFVSHVYNTISSSISISTYESYIIVPSTKFLSIVSYTSMLSEPTCQYLTQLIHDGRTILIPSIMALFVQSYPIQYMFVLYIAYIVPLYKCCIDTDTTSPFNTTTTKPQQQQQRYRTTQQWLQYWIIQTILTSTVQSVSSILYWIPFSTTLLYCFYVYITIILSPSTISHIYEQYIHGEIQYLIHFVTASTTATNTTNSVTITNHENNIDSVHSSRTIQLWNYILDRVPKAKMEESITTTMTMTAFHPSPIDDNETDETTTCAE